MTGSNTNHEHGDTVDVVAEKGKRDRENGMWSDELVVERVRSEENDMQRKLDELRDQGRRVEIYEFIHKYRPGKPVGIRPTTRGAFNIVFGVDFTDGSALLRLVVQGSTAFPDEKIQAEVATMRYVAKMTTIRVPRIYHWGTAAENPLGLGPFIIMEYIPHTKTVCNVLKDPAIEELTYACIDPDIPRDKLDRMYTQIARLLLQLSTLEMPKIGCLVEDGDSWTVGSRPLTLEMNNLIVQGGIPPAVLPAEHTTYSSSDEFYAALADLHVAHLTFQRNKAVESADDCRDKFVARYLFRQLARQRRLPAPPSAGSTPKKEKFRLCIDDFRPHNILVDDDLNVVGVIDWEYAYFAPESFARDPPYWLLLCRPERYYHGTVLDFKPEYENALDVFCAALRAEEDLAALREEEQGDSDWEWSIEQHIGALDLKSEPEPDRVRLSDRMRENYASGAFWADYATRRCYGFEPVFWEFLDERFFGKNVDGGYEGRMHLLPDKVKRRMEWFVDKKLQESEERKLVDWDPKEARSYLAEILADLDE